LLIKSIPPLYLSTGNFTIELWVNTANGSLAQQLLLRRAAVTARGFVMDINSYVANKVGFLCGDTNTTAWEVTLTSTTSVNSNTWYHLAVVRSGNTFSLYVNGVSEATATSSVVIADDTSNLLIGVGDTGTTYLNGYIDDLRITKGYARYTSNFTPPTKAFPNTGPV